MRVRLTRTVRFTLRTRTAPAAEREFARDNTFAAWPPPSGLRPWYEIDVCVQGEPDGETGYLMGIDVIDDVVRRLALPILEDAFQSGTDTPLPRLLERIAEQLGEELGQGLHSVCWRLTPRHTIQWRRNQSHQQTTKETMTMTERNSGRILISDRFEFSAAHRLHCPDRSDEWNRERFGKCNNPRGHGHNYEIEVRVESGLLEDGTSRLSIERLESIVDAEVISRFDHRYLNEECPEFMDRNPSVENITITCHGLLDEPISEAGGALASVTVWETGKTSCTYPTG